MTTNELTILKLLNTKHTVTYADIEPLMESTGAMIFPTGTTAQRPSTPQAGMVRFNSTTSRFEGYNGSEWINIDIPDDWGSVTETP